MRDEFRLASGRRTICEVLREIHDAGDAQIQHLTEEALTMAKRMDAKLREYNTNWSENFFEKNLDQPEDRTRRLAR